MKTSCLKLLLLATLACGALRPAARAAIYNWNSPNSGAWGNPANWTPPPAPAPPVPGPADTAIIGPFGGVDIGDPSFGPPSTPFTVDSIVLSSGPGGSIAIDDTSNTGAPGAGWNQLTVTTSITKNGGGRAVFNATRIVTPLLTMNAGDLRITDTNLFRATNANINGGILCAGAITPGTAIGGGVWTVNGGGTLNINGILNVTIITNLGTVNPGCSVGTATVIGDYVLGASASSTFELDIPNIVGSPNDHFIIDGDFTLDGILDVVALGNFGVGTYRLFDYSGTLTDNVLDLGSRPTGYSYAINTATMGQVNLIVSLDMDPPVLASVTTSCASNMVTLKFNEPVTGTGDPFIYAISDGVPIMSVVVADGRTVHLFTSPLDHDFLYTLTVCCAQDLAGNHIDPGSSLNFACQLPSLGLTTSGPFRDLEPKVFGTSDHIIAGTKTSTTMCQWWGVSASAGPNATVYTASGVACSSPKPSNLNPNKPIFPALVTVTDWINVGGGLPDASPSDTARAGAVSYLSFYPDGSSGTVWFTTIYGKDPPPGTTDLSLIGFDPVTPELVFYGEYLDGGNSVTTYPAHFAATSSRTGLSDLLGAGFDLSTFIGPSNSIFYVFQTEFPVAELAGKGPPTTITCPTGAVATAACGQSCAPVTYPLPTVLDGTLVSCTPASGSCFPIGTSNVFCVATNYCGVPVACDFSVIVTAPPPGGCPTNCIPPPANLVLWLPFDATSGTTAQNLAGGNNGTHFNGPAFNPGSHVANSLCFDGVNDYVEVASYPAIGFGTNDFSVDAWVKPAALESTIRIIVDHRESSGNGVIGYSLFLGGNNGLGFQIGDGAFINYPSTLSVPFDGQWHLVAVTVKRNDSQGIHFYVDGVKQALGRDTIPYNGSVTPAANFPLRVGARSFSPDGIFNGCIDEVELFNRELAPAEITALYNAGSAGKCKTNSCNPTNLLCNPASRTAPSTTMAMVARRCC